MVPSSPQSLTPQGVELTIDNLVDGGDLYVAESFVSSSVLPLVNYEIPKEGTSVTKLSWDAAQGEWVTTQSDVYPYKVIPLGGGSYKFLREGNVNSFAVIIAQVVDGVINWVNAEETPRLDFVSIFEGIMFEEEERSYRSESDEVTEQLQNTTQDLFKFRLSYGDNVVASASEFSVEAEQGISAEVVAGDEAGFMTVRLLPSTITDDYYTFYVYHGDEIIATVYL